MKAVCSIEGCANEVRCLGLCNKHYHVLKNQRRMKPCGCGCGELTANRFKWGHQTRLFSSEEQARRGRMNDGSKKRDKGLGISYRKVKGKHEHRLVAEQMLGRPLLVGEIVHHIDENIRNNSPSNLEVMTQSKHIQIHFPEMMSARKAKHGY